MDESLFTWGYFLTYNSLNQLASDDSDHDYNGIDGRVVMQFDPFCIPNINVRHIMLEFISVEEGQSCLDNLDSCPLGDMNDDGNYNVLDIVALANCVLGSNCAELENGCAGDLNGDGNYNVLDIVALANCVLGSNCGGRIDDAKKVEFMIRDQQLIYAANGFVGGIQMTLQHGPNFSIKLTDDALYSNHITEGNETRLIIVTPETNKLFTFVGEFEISNFMVANSHEEIEVTLPKQFGLSPAFPNPFNPTTTLDVTLLVSGNMNVVVYNIEGKLVDTLASGFHIANTYSLVWKAEDVPSGIYFIQVESNGLLSTQKIMLVK